MLLQEHFSVTPWTDSENKNQTLLKEIGLNAPGNAVLLDAAANSQVPELLGADSGDAYCLWQGDARDKFGDHAPWIASLKTDGHILRNLMTDGPAAWHWWGRWPGIVIASRNGVANLRKHLRRLGSVTDGNGRRYILRHWEPAMAEAFWASHGDQPDHVAWRFGADVAAVYWPTSTGIAKVSLADAQTIGTAPKNAIDQYRPLFRAASWKRFQRRIAVALDGEGRPFENTGLRRTKQLCDAARTSGYKSEAAIWDVVRATILIENAGCDMQTEAFNAWGETPPPDHRSAARRLLVHAQSVSDKVLEE